MKIAIPSKGRLLSDSFDWFTKRGINIARKENEREYRAEAVNRPDIEIILMSAGEMPQGLERGDVDLAVTGQDLVQEKVHNWHEKIREEILLGFGFADLVLAIPASWVDVVDLLDLDEVASDFLKEHKHRLRVATKYHRIVGNYLRQNNVTNFQLIDSQGATEGVVANEYAELIADITSSGETLRANNLRILGAPILKSQAVLFRSAKSYDNEDINTFIQSLTNT